MFEKIFLAKPDDGDLPRAIIDRRLDERSLELGNDLFPDRPDRRHKSLLGSFRQLRDDQTDPSVFIAIGKTIKKVENRGKPAPLQAGLSPGTDRGEAREGSGQFQSGKRGRSHNLPSGEGRPSLAMEPIGRSGALPGQGVCDNPRRSVSYRHPSYARTREIGTPSSTPKAPPRPPILRKRVSGKDHLFPEETEERVFGEREGDCNLPTKWIRL